MKRHSLGYFAFLALSISSFGASADSWIPYTAKYIEVSTTTFHEGKQTHTTKLGQEVRSADGSKANFEILNGQRISGQLWLSCGEVVTLDYEKKNAQVSQRSSPQHMHIPPDQPLGTATIAGVTATGYPIHFPQGGSGSIWIEMNTEIPVKLEYHTSENGVTTDYIKQLTSLDLDVTNSDAAMKVPEGFSISASSGTGSGTCRTNTSAR